RYSSAAAFRSDLEAAARTGIVNAPAVAAPVAATQVLGGQSPFPPSGAAAANGNEGFPAIDEMEEEEDPQRSKARIWMLLVALLNKEPPVEEPEQVAVPELEQGMTEDEVRRILDESQLEMVVQDPKADDEIEEGRLLEWDPDSGTMVDEETPVNVTFSAGPDSLVMPDVTGYKKDRAQDALIGEGFDPKNFVWETEHVAGTEKDEVTRTSPEDGESVKPD